MPQDIRFLSGDLIHEKFRDNPEISGVGVRKQFILKDVREVEGEELENEEEGSGKESRILEFVISTEAKDRHGDIIEVEGFELDNFKKNPVILFAHNSMAPPIGRAVDIEILDGELVAKAEFMGTDIDPTGFSDTIFRMLKGGFLKATSVGFFPIDMEFMFEDGDEEGEQFFTGIHFLKQELVEFSVVPVPANPEALIRAKTAGINLKPLDSWFEEALDKWTEYKDILLVPKSDITTLYNTVHKGLKNLPKRKKLEVKKPDTSTEVRKKAISFKESHSEGTPANLEAEWDLAQVLESAEVDDLFAMSAWVADKEADALEKTDFEFVHHTKEDDFSVIWNGLIEAMGNLLGATGEVDIPDDERELVYDHLAQHYNDDFSEEPPEFKFVAGKFFAEKKEFYPFVLGLGVAFDLKSSELIIIFEEDEDPEKVYKEEALIKIVKRRTEYLIDQGKDISEIENDIQEMYVFLDIHLEEGEPSKGEEEEEEEKATPRSTWRADAETEQEKDTKCIALVTIGDKEIRIEAPDAESLSKILEGFDKKQETRSAEIRTDTSTNQENDKDDVDIDSEEISELIKELVPELIKEVLHDEVTRRNGNLDSWPNRNT